MGEVAQDQCFRSEDAPFKPPRSPLIIRTDQPTSQVHPSPSEFDPSAISQQGQHPNDAWLPITESRNGNAYFAAFHILNSNIGFHALLLPVALATLGWYVP